MNVLKKILEEIEERIKKLKEADNMCRVNAERNRNFESVKYFQSLIFATERAESVIGEIIRSHMDEADKKEFEFDFNRVESFDCQCGRRYVNTYNDGWIPVEERLPEEKTEVLCCFEDGTVQSLWQNWKNDGLGDYLDDDLMPTELIAWQPLPEPYKPKGERR